MKRLLAGIVLTFTLISPAASHAGDDPIEDAVEQLNDTAADMDKIIKDIYYGVQVCMECH